jgi:peroxiredoxin
MTAWNAIVTYETLELGPLINYSIPRFILSDDEGHQRNLDDLMGPGGLFLGFIGDMWQPTSVRRILWLQRHIPRLTSLGTPVALFVRDHFQTLRGFRMCSPLPVPFPLLADTDGVVHRDYGLDRYPGLLLIDRQGILRHKWLMPDDRVWPNVNELAQAAQSLAAFAYK